MRPSFIFVALALAPWACSSSSTSGDGGTVQADGGSTDGEASDGDMPRGDGGAMDGNTAATTVACPNASNGPMSELCDAATQYCIQTGITLMDGGFSLSASTCAPLPAGCSECTCIGGVEAAWKLAQNGTGNCSSAVITCRAKNGAVAATCTK